MTWDLKYNMINNYFFGLAPNLFLPFELSPINKKITKKPIIGINASSTNHPDLSVSCNLLTAAAHSGIEFAIDKIEKIRTRSP